MLFKLSSLICMTKNDMGLHTLNKWLNVKEIEFSEKVQNVFCK